jgi:hypothetical protein
MKTKNDAANMQQEESRDLGIVLSAIVLTAGFVALILFAIFH